VGQHAIGHEVGELHALGPAFLEEAGAVDHLRALFHLFEEGGVVGDFVLEVGVLDEAVRAFGRLQCRANRRPLASILNMLNEMNALVLCHHLLDLGHRGVAGAVIADDDLLFESDRLGVNRRDLPEHFSDRALFAVGGDQDGQQHAAPWYHSPQVLSILSFSYLLLLFPGAGEASTNRP
jgi:hypothetical protein